MKGEQLQRLAAAQSAGNDFLMYTHQHGQKLDNLLAILTQIPDTEAAAKRRERFVTKILTQQRVKPLMMYENLTDQNATGAEVSTTIASITPKDTYSVL